MAKGRCPTTRTWLFTGVGVAGVYLLLGILPGELLSQDDSSGTWLVTGYLGKARTLRATATRLPDGQVLIVGGQADKDGSGQGISNATSTAELYDPETGAFVPMGSMGSHGQDIQPIFWQMAGC